MLICGRVAGVSFFFTTVKVNIFFDLMNEREKRRLGYEEFKSAFQVFLSLLFLRILSFCGVVDNLQTR